VLNKEFFKFLIAGVMNTIVGYSAFVFFFLRVGIRPEVANAIAYAIALTLAYLLNKYFVFSKSKTNYRTVVRFLFSFVLAFGLNQLALNIMYRRLGIIPEISQLISMSVYTIAFYVLNKHFAFKYHKT
jgi:putative flippase GtrA